MMNFAAHNFTLIEHNYLTYRKICPRLCNAVSARRHPPLPPPRAPAWFPGDGDRERDCS